MELNEQEIIEGNKLISKFISNLKDYEPYNDVGDFIDGGYWAVDKAPSKYFNWWDMEFSTNWSWLMPVIEKIEAMGYKTIAGGGDIWGNYINIATGLNFVTATEKDPSKFTGQGKTKIQAYFSGIIQFLSWYNNQ